jgi:hypothetical protein
MHLEQTCPSPRTRCGDRRSDARRTSTANDDICVVAQLDLLSRFVELVILRGSCLSRSVASKGC